VSELDRNGYPHGMAEEAMQIYKDILADWHDMPSEFRRRLENPPGDPKLPLIKHIVHAISIDLPGMPDHLKRRVDRMQNRLPEWD